VFIFDGYVCAGASEDAMKVKEIKILQDMIMIITFSNGEQRLFDATILSGQAFEPLKNVDIFTQARIEHGVVTWMDGEIDCAPEYMYEHSYEYSKVS
jgi:hypothetical protein